MGERQGKDARRRRGYPQGGAYHGPVGWGCPYGVCRIGQGTKSQSSNPGSLLARRPRAPPRSHGHGQGKASTRAHKGPCGRRVLGVGVQGMGEVGTGKQRGGAGTLPPPLSSSSSAGLGSGGGAPSATNALGNRVQSRGKGNQGAAHLAPVDAAHGDGRCGVGRRSCAHVHTT